MTIKIIGIHIPSIFLSFNSKADNTILAPSQQPISLKLPEKDNTSVLDTTHLTQLIQRKSMSPHQTSIILNQFLITPMWEESLMNLLNKRSISQR